MRPQVADILDDADQALRRGCGSAQIEQGSIVSRLPQVEQARIVARRVGQRGAERLHQRLALLQEMQRHAPRRARAEPGQPAEQLDQPLDWAFIAGAPRQCASSLRRRARVSTAA